MGLQEDNEKNDEENEYNEISMGLQEDDEKMTRKMNTTKDKK